MLSDENTTNCKHEEVSSCWLIKIFKARVETTILKLCKLKANHADGEDRTHLYVIQLRGMSSPLTLHSQNSTGVLCQSLILFWNKQCNVNSWAHADLHETPVWVSWASSSHQKRWTLERYSRSGSKIKPWDTMTIQRDFMLKKAVSHQQIL